MRIVLLIAAFLFSEIAGAACQLEFDKAKNEEPFGLRTNAGQVPITVRDMKEERYSHVLVAQWSYFDRREPERKNPRLYFYDQKSCEVLKIIELYPKDYNLAGCSSCYFGVSYNKSLGRIYVTTRSVGTYPTESKFYKYTDIYSYDDLSHLSRLEGEAPLSNAEFIQDGKKVVGFDYSKRDTEGTQIVIWSANDFTELKRSDPIGKEELENLGIQFSKSDIVIMYFEEKQFKERGYDVEFEDQYVIKARGFDDTGNRLSVQYDLEGNPLLVIRRANGKVIVESPPDYEKKFNLKISPLKFTDVHTQAGTSQTQMDETFKKKPIPPEPTPVVKPYKPVTIEEMIARTQEIKKKHAQQLEEEARQQEEVKVQQQNWVYIALLIVIASIVVVIYFLRRSRKK